MVRVEKLNEHVRPLENQYVRVKEAGAITEIMFCTGESSPPPILKLNVDQYCDLRTGEVFEYVHTSSRAESKKEVARSLARLRDLINANVNDVTHCRWITLTYAENMTDSKRLLEDFRAFNRRMRKRVGSYKYITAAEPQGRGAWHLHVIMIFDRKAPFIPNEDVSADWRQGFVMIKKLEDVDNVGAYLTAYLGDMDLQEGQADGVISLEDIRHGTCKEVEYEENGEQKKKYYLKGARLKLYPPGFHLYRFSRGIKQPEVSVMIEKEAREKARGATLTFEKTLSLTDEEKDFQRVLNYRYYNSKRRENQ